MALRQAAAVVMNVMDHGESDKIVTLYSQAHGKLTGIAKGAKRSKKRFVNKLEVFTLLDVQYMAGKRSTLVRIDQAELVSPFPNLRNSFERYAAATLICELTMRWTRENDGDSELFALVVWAFKGIAKCEPIQRTLILFQVKLLELLGYQPNLSGCFNCGLFDSSGSPFYFSPSLGGLLCTSCNGRKTSAQTPISLNTAKLLLKAQTLDRCKLGRLQFSKRSAMEAISMFRKYDRYLLQHDIQSWNYIASW